MAHPLSSPTSLPDDPIPSYEATGDEEQSMKKSLLGRVERSHRSWPGIRKIPLPAIGIIALIAIVNVVVWIAAAIVLVRLALFIIISQICCDSIALVFKFEKYWQMLVILCFNILFRSIFARFWIYKHHIF